MSSFYATRINSCRSYKKKDEVEEDEVVVYKEEEEEEGEEREEYDLQVSWLDH